MMGQDYFGRRVLFIAPRSSGPAGGVKVLLEHAAVLRSSGIDVLVLTRDAEHVRHDWGMDAPIHVGAVEGRPGDLYVWPETFNSRQLQVSPRGDVHNVLLVQNQFYLFNFLRDGSGLADLPLAGVAATSIACKRYLETYCDVENVPVIPCGVETGPVDSSAKKDWIAVMPRKRSHEAAFIKNHFRRRFSEFKHFEWVEIDDMTHAEVMGTLRQARVSLSLQRFEGLGLPALEAMASGCLVAGFTGQGGEEYATSENGIWVAEDDMEGAANALGEVMVMARESPAMASQMIEHGMRTAARYTIEARDDAALAFYRGVLDATARQT